MSKAAPKTQSESRKDALTMLRDQSKAADVMDDGQFRRLINACQAILEMTDGEIADVLMVSRPTVNRWSNGRNLPHRGVRRSIFRWISDDASKRLRNLEKYDGESLAQDLLGSQITTGRVG